MLGKRLRKSKLPSSRLIPVQEQFRRLDILVRRHVTGRNAHPTDQIAEFFLERCLDRKIASGLSPHPNWSGQFQERRHCQEQRLRLHFRPRQTGSGVQRGPTWILSPACRTTTSAANRKTAKWCGSRRCGSSINRERADGGLRQVSNVAVSPRLRLNPNGTLAYSPPPVTTLEEAAALRSITVGGRIRCSRCLASRRFWGDAGNSGLRPQPRPRLTTQIEVATVGQRPRDA